MPLGSRITNLDYPLHAAKVGGLPYRLVMTISGSNLTLLGSLTVFIFWSNPSGLPRRRSASSRESRAKRVGSTPLNPAESRAENSLGQIVQAEFKMLVPRNSKDWKWEQAAKNNFYWRRGVQAIGATRLAKTTRSVGNQAWQLPHSPWASIAT